MIKYISDYIIDRIYSEKDNDERKEIYSYGLQLLICDLSAFVVIVLYALVSNTASDSLIFILTFCIVRNYSGGYHCKSNLRCNVVFLLTYCVYLYCSKINYDYFHIYIVSIIIIISLSPIDDTKKRIPKNKFRKYKCVVYINLILINASFFILDGQIIKKIQVALILVSFFMIIEFIKEVMFNEKAD